MRNWVIALAGLALAAIAVSAIVVVVVPDDIGYIDRERRDALAYLAVAGFIIGDAVFPVLPGETVVNAAAVLAAQGDLNIVWVVIAASFGAVAGDNALYWIARLSAERVRAQADRVRADSRVQTVLRILGERAALFIVLGRYVPECGFSSTRRWGSRSTTTGAFCCGRPLAA
jgi:membrane protein DedA with SNARE-associated domain